MPLWIQGYGLKLVGPVCPRNSFSAEIKTRTKIINLFRDRGEQNLDLIQNSCSTQLADYEIGFDLKTNYTYSCPQL